MPRLRHALRRASFTIAVIVATASPAWSSTDLPALAARQAIMRSIVESWREAQRDDGFLPYGYDFLADRATDEPKSEGYIVRQAGAFFGWAEYYRFSRDARFQDSIRRGIAALEARSLPVGKARAQGWIETTRVLSMPVFRWKLHSALDTLGWLYQPAGPGKLVSANGSYEGAVTGATALALLAELAYAQASGDNRYAALRAAWLEGLLMLQVPGQGFRERPTSIDTSPYYDGESWLALSRYVDLNRTDERAAKVLSRAEDALMAHYTAHPEFGFYHWGAMAAAQRWRTTADARYVRYLKEQAAIFLVRFKRSLEPDANTCGAMEGMTATLRVLLDSGDDDRALAGRVRAFIATEAVKIPRMQIAPGQTRLAMGGRAEVLSPRLRDFGGALRFGLYDPKTRVDAAQHCLSALMQMPD